MEEREEVEFFIIPPLISRTNFRFYLKEVTLVDLGSDPEEQQWLLESELEESTEQEPRPLLMLQWQLPEQQEPEPQQQELVARQPGPEQQQQEPEPELVRPDPAVAPALPAELPVLEELEEPLRPVLVPVADLFGELPGEAAVVAGAGRQPRTLARSPAVRRSTRSLHLPTVEGLGQATKSKGGRI